MSDRTFNDMLAIEDSLCQEVLRLEAEAEHLRESLEHVCSNMMRMTRREIYGTLIAALEFHPKEVVDGHFIGVDAQDDRHP